MTHKKINFAFSASQIFYIFNFYIAHWQNADLLRSGPRNKKSFNHVSSPACLTYLTKTLIKSCCGKNVFLLSKFTLCITSVDGSYFSKIAGFLPATFSKMNTLTGIVQGFYPDFKQFPIACNIFQKTF